MHDTIIWQQIAFCNSTNKLQHAKIFYAPLSTKAKKVQLNAIIGIN